MGASAAALLPPSPPGPVQPAMSAGRDVAAVARRARRRIFSSLGGDRKALCRQAEDSHSSGNSGGGCRGSIDLQSLNLGFPIAIHIGQLEQSTGAIRATETWPDRCSPRGFETRWRVLPLWLSHHDTPPRTSASCDTLTVAPRTHDNQHIYICVWRVHMWTQSSHKTRVRGDSRCTTQPSTPTPAH